MSARQRSLSWTGRAAPAVRRARRFPYHPIVRWFSQKNGRRRTNRFRRSCSCAVQRALSSENWPGRRSKVAWLGLSIRGMLSRLFPRVLDTGHSHNFSIKNEYLESWAGLYAHEIHTIGHTRVNGQRRRIKTAIFPDFTRTGFADMVGNCHNRRYRGGSVPQAEDFPLMAAIDEQVINYFHALFARVFSTPSAHRSSSG